MNDDGPSDGYYYLHSENWRLIWKKFHPDSGGFVIRVWPVNHADRMTAWVIILEALALGARTDQIRELAQKWGCTSRDLIEFMIRNPHPSSIQRVGFLLFLMQIERVDPKAWLDWLSATPPGQDPDFSLMPKSATSPSKESAS